MPRGLESHPDRPGPAEPQAAAPPGRSFSACALRRRSGVTFLVWPLGRGSSLARFLAPTQWPERPALQRFRRLGDGRLDDDVDLRCKLQSAVAGILHGDLLALVKRIGPHLGAVITKASVGQPMNDLLAGFMRLVKEKQFARRFDGTNRSIEPGACRDCRLRARRGRTGGRHTGG